MIIISHRCIIILLCVYTQLARMTFSTCSTGGLSEKYEDDLDQAKPDRGDDGYMYTNSMPRCAKCKKQLRHTLSPSPASSHPSPSLSLPAMPHGCHRPTAPDPGAHVFQHAASKVLPDPARFFAPRLLSAPLPTNSFFQNYVLKNGDQPEYIHPYSIRSAGGALTVCHPTRQHSPTSVNQTFVEDLIISSPSDADGGHHRVVEFHDLSVTLDVSPSLRAHLVRGCPYVTVTTMTSQCSRAVDISVASVHAFIEVASCDDCGNKWRLRMNSGQTFLLYASAPIHLAQTDTSHLSASGFTGVIRVAYLPDAYMEPVLDAYSGCFPTAGEAALNRPFCLEYTWRKAGPGELLMLAHPLHLRLLSNDCAVKVLDDFRYRSIDGDLVGVVGDSWDLRTDPVSPTWHSTHGVSEDGVAEVVAALRADVAGLASTPITTTSSYFYGKAVARVARFALIAEEVGCPEVIPAVQSYLKTAVTPWLDGTFQGNGFFYDSKWGGLVTQQGLNDTGGDFGFGIYNDHHYHLGYFLYAIAVLAKIDPCWGRKYMPQAYSMVADFMTLSRNKPCSSYTRLRMFDLWKLHSWAGGLTEFADGRNQESTSEAVNAYYSAALLGLSYGDTHLATLGATLTAFEALAAQTWWHVREGDGMYEDDFSSENRVVGVLWANKRDSGLWFAPPEWKECRLGIQLLPILPICEALFPDVGFVKDLVTWTEPALARDGAGEGWKGFAYALEGIYDKEAALARTRALTGHDDGNSLTNLLWWLHSRPGVDGDAGYGRCCWYRQYCH